MTWNVKGETCMFKKSKTRRATQKIELQRCGLLALLYNILKAMQRVIHCLNTCIPLPVATARRAEQGIQNVNNLLVFWSCFFGRQHFGDLPQINSTHTKVSITQVGSVVTPRIFSHQDQVKRIVSLTVQPTIMYC